MKGWTLSAFYLHLAILGLLADIYARPFSIIESAQIPNDRVEVILVAETRADARASAYAEAKGLVDQAYSFHNDSAQVEISALNQNPAMYCINNCRKREWIVRTVVHLKSASAVEIANVASSLPAVFVLDNIRFNVSPQTRSRIEGQLVRNALKRFATETPHGDEFSSIQITVSNRNTAPTKLTQILKDDLQLGYSKISVEVIDTKSD